MVTKFDKKLLEIARAYYYCVLVDQDRITHFEGSETATEGCRVRIYATGWQYETSDTLYTNDELAEYIARDRESINDFFSSIGSDLVA